MVLCVRQFHFVLTQRIQPNSYFENIFVDFFVFRFISTYLRSTWRSHVNKSRFIVKKINKNIFKILIHGWILISSVQMELSTAKDQRKYILRFVLIELPFKQSWGAELCSQQSKLRRLILTISLVHIAFCAWRSIWNTSLGFTQRAFGWLLILTSSQRTKRSTFLPEKDIQQTRGNYSNQQNSIVFQIHSEIDS